LKKLMTKRRYELSAVVSALQKAIRRADARMAGYWAIEMFESNFREYLWRRLLTISAEDCWGCITLEITALYGAWQQINKQKPGGGRIFASKAVILLCMARKNRDADHLTNLVYDPKRIDAAAEAADMEAGRADPAQVPEEIPDYAYDCHTQRGKIAGKTKTHFFIEEQEALNPRQRGLFDQDVADLEALAKGKGAP